MSKSMGELDSIKIIKKKLMESLGDKNEEYLKLISKWFRMKGTREQLEADLNIFLTPHQKHLHDQLLLHLLQKCVDTPSVISDSCSRHYRDFEKFQKGFEPIDPTFFVLTERQEVNSEMPHYMIHEKLLPDQSTALARLMYSAWELGLDGSQPNTAEFLMIATQNFLKNILTAVITRKKGYKCSQNGFIHGFGCASPNPWLTNVAKRKPDQFHSLRFDGALNNGIVKPAERPTAEELENEAMFRLSASPCDQEAGSISLYDLIITLQLYPSLIASNFVRVVNTERMYARLCHPVIDD